MNKTDLRIRQALQDLSAADPEYWSFKKRSKRDLTHSLFPYPAMMVPAMQGEIIDVLAAAQPELSVIRDPFAGSGTTLTEAMIRGFSYYGNDINPLSILICKVKSGPFYEKALEARASELIARIKRNIGRDFYFEQIDKWFLPNIQRGLSRIRAAIIKEPSLPIRRFFWVAFASTIRQVSNSRTSTFKLHVRSAEEIKRLRAVDPLTLFERVLVDNQAKLKAIHDLLIQKKLVKNGRYTRSISIELADSKHHKIKESSPQLVITSPPYGDNKTTVPYGQFSYLPLQWIVLSDIDKSVSQDILSSTSFIDSSSLGGSLRCEEKRLENLLSSSPAAATTLQNLQGTSLSGQKRVVSFFCDLAESIETIGAKLPSKSHMVWTVGNRTVSQLKIPTDQVLIELLEAKTFEKITTLDRSIPSKRMAVKNSTGKTMATETVHIFRKQ